MIKTLRLSLSQFLNRNYFRKEIIYVILLKIILLFLLWGLFLPNALHPQDYIQHLTSHVN